jgi:hypothetical protein
MARQRQVVGKLRPDQAGAHDGNALRSSAERGAESGIHLQIVDAPA